MRTPSTRVTTELLEQDFAHFGYPHTLVTDNPTTFTSQELQALCKARGIIPLTGAPYHPATNGVVERLVQTFKIPEKVEVTVERSSSGIPDAIPKDPLLSGYSPSEPTEWEADLYQAGCNGAVSNSRGGGYSG